MEERFQKLRSIYERSRENSIIKNFYSKEINKGKSYRAMSLDKIGLVLILFIALTVFFASITKTLILPVYMSLLVIYLFTKYIVNLRKRKVQVQINKVNEDLKSNRVLREISQLNREEFVNYVKIILEKYYLSEFVYGEDGIDLVGTIKDKGYAVKCIKSTQEDKIINKKIKEFSNYINYLEYDEGIIVTNSFFQDGAKDNNTLMLIDFNALKGMLKNINEYPTDDDINNYIKHRYDDSRKDINYQIKSITLNKIIKLYIVFIIFYSLSFFVSYSLFYKIMGILAFLIATILGGVKYTNYIKHKDEMPLQ